MYIVLVLTNVFNIEKKTYTHIWVCDIAKYMYLFNENKLEVPVHYNYIFTL